MTKRQIKLGAIVTGVGGPGQHFRWLDPEIPGDASVNVPIAAAKIDRAPKRSATHPLIGMNTASVSRYAVMPMFRFTAPTWKLLAICGSAVAMIVPSRFSMKNAPAISIVT